MKGRERERESDREIHSWLGFPYHSQHSWIMKKEVIFGWGGRCREKEIQGVIVVKNSACVCVRSAHNIPPVSPFYIFSKCCLVLNVCSVYLSDCALMQL